MTDSKLFFVCIGLSFCAAIVTWGLAIGIFSWMVNIRNTERWLRPYRAYNKALWTDFSAINEIFYNL